jgi:hypothetical protein
MPEGEKDEVDKKQEGAPKDSKSSSSVEKFEKILEKRKKQGPEEKRTEPAVEKPNKPAPAAATPSSSLGVYDPKEVAISLDGMKKEQARIANILTTLLGDFEEEKKKSAILDDRLNSLLKKDEKQESLLSAVDNKLSQILERERAEQERIERLSQLRRLEEDELSDSLGELSEIYEMTQKKLAVAREDMALVKEKLKSLLDVQKIDEEKKLIGLTRAHELTQQRMEALDDLTKLKDPSEKEKSLVLMLKKGREELERELEGEIAGDPVKLAALLRREKSKGALPAGAAGAKPINCPVCHTKFEVTSNERPLKIQCPSCGAVGILKK